MSLREKAIGAWELVSYQTENEEGETVYPLGEDATGYIMYTPDGYMSAQLMQQGRSAYESGDIHQGTQEEMAEAAEGYMAYSGRRSRTLDPLYGGIDEPDMVRSKPAPRSFSRRGYLVDL